MRQGDAQWRLQWERIVGDTDALHRPRVSDFLDPAQQSVLADLLTHHPHIFVRADGGYAQAERKRIALCVHEDALTDDVCALSLVVVRPDGQARVALDHGDYLGAVLALGVKREKVGDIIVERDHAYVIAVRDIGTLIAQELRQVGAVTVHAASCAWSSIADAQTTVQPMTCTVASMRLDGIVGEVYHLSRARVNVPIKAGKCKLNWKPEYSPSALVRVGDTISLQGYGRFRVTEQLGVTRSGRIRLTVEKYG
jgi:RNA-binding protein YlmH